MDDIFGFNIVKTVLKIKEIFVKSTLKCPKLNDEPVCKKCWVFNLNAYKNPNMQNTLKKQHDKIIMLKITDMYLNIKTFKNKQTVYFHFNVEKETKKRNNHFYNNLYFYFRSNFDTVIQFTCR